MEIDKKRIKFLVLLTLLGSIFTIFYMIFTGNGHEVYNDIIIEWTAMTSSNKSAEMFLVYILTFGGLFTYFIYYLVSARCDKRIPAKVFNSNNAEKFLPKLILITISFIVAWQSVIYWPVNWFLIVMLLYTILVFSVDKKLMLSSLIFFFTTFYSVCSFYRLYVFLGGNSHLDIIVTTIIAVVLSSLIFLFKDRCKALSRGMLIEQLVLPNLLLVYLANKYMNGNDIKIIDVLIQVKILITILILAFLWEAIYILKKNWNGEIVFDKIFSYGSCISIMAFNLFHGSGSIMPIDMHHPFENIIGYSQIFELGQVPFKEYIPVSGMYSIIHGYMFSIWGHGLLSQYFTAENIYCLLISILIVFLLKKQLNGKFVLLISILYCFIPYNRIFFILPIMLLLSLPRLIENKNLWLLTWVFTSFLQFLYYPLFGAAVGLAYMPLGIYQVITFLKSTEFKTQIKNFLFWLYWIFCWGAIVLSLPLVLGTLKHTHAMSDQTILADGIARFGERIGQFMPYLSSNVILKIVLFSIFSFVIPVLFVWVAFALTLKISGLKICDKKIKVENFKDASVICSLVIFPLISFTFTFIRLDIDSLYARSTGVLLIGAVMLIIYANRYLKDDLIKYFITCFGLIIPLSCCCWGILNVREQLTPSYTVPPGYEYIKNDKVKKLGTGFMEKGQYLAVENFSSRIDNNFSYFGLDWFGFYYLCNIKGVSVLEAMMTLKGINAAEESINALKTNNSIVGNLIKSYDNYYFYHWLLTSGNYIWDTKNRIFLPNKGKYSSEYVKQKNKLVDIALEGYDIGKSANSLGLSVKTLMPIFKNIELPCKISFSKSVTRINFDKSVNGNDIDFIYVEFANANKIYKFAQYDMGGIQDVPKQYKVVKYLMKKIYNPGRKVKVEWLDDSEQMHFILCDFEQGKLLIPLGAGRNWLLDSHSYINIKVLQDNQETVIPKIKDIKFLKLREAK